MFKLALDAGHGLYTAGKRCLKAIDPNETREWVLNNRICNKIQVKLQDYIGIEVLRVDDTTGQTDISLTERCKRANNWGATFYLSVHHNAGINGGSGGGLETYRHSSLISNGNTAKKQEIITNELINAGVPKGNRSSNIKSADFAVLRDTSMEAVLIECGFMDSSVDVPIILTDEFAEKVANGCVNAIVKFGNLQKKTIANDVVVPEKAEPEIKLENIVETIKPEIANPKTSTTFVGWLKSTGIKVVKTMAETALAVIGTNAIGVTEVDWLGVGSAVILSGVVTILFNIKAIPESEGE